MDEVGSELVDRILPDVPFRQWVLSVPWDLSALAARKAQVLSALVRSLWRALHKELISVSKEEDAETGVVTFVQRFGSSLNLHTHLHVLAPDGVFVRDGRGVRFVHVTVDRAMVERVVERAKKSMLRWLGKKGYLADRESAPTEEPNGLGVCQQIALQYGQLVGLSSSQTKSGANRLDKKHHGSRHARTDDGFDLDANVAIAAGDDEGRERVVRYCARPAIALEHLSKLPDGRFAYKTKYARNGRSHRVMTGAELMARIAALVPPPRFPLLRYSGVFSAAHTWRQWIVPKAPKPSCDHAQSDDPRNSPQSSSPPQYQDDNDPPAQPSELRSPYILTDAHLRRLLDGALVMTKSRATWAMLLRRSLGIRGAQKGRWSPDEHPVLDCPTCHGRLELISVVKDKTEARRLLQHLGRPSEPPKVALARDPTLDQVA